MPSLKLVSTKEPWERLDNESEEAFLTFLTWLHGDTPRKAPTESALALRHNWSERALAFDQRTAAPKEGRDQLQSIAKSLMALAEGETRKLLRDSEGSLAPTVNVKDIVTIMSYLAEAKQTLGNLFSDDTDYNLDELSTDEIELLYEARKMLKRLKRAG